VPIKDSSKDSSKDISNRSGGMIKLRMLSTRAEICAH
jgi:hypothetical protein